MRAIVWLVVILNAAVPLVAAADRPPTYFITPCQRHGQHAEDRWEAKTDAEEVPPDSRRIQTFKPSQIYSWPPIAGLSERSRRKAPEEERWVRVTGRIVDVRAQVDGDIRPRKASCAREDVQAHANSPLLFLWSLLKTS